MQLQESAVLFRSAPIRLRLNVAAVRRPSIEPTLILRELEHCVVKEDVVVQRNGDRVDTRVGIMQDFEQLRIPVALHVPKMRVQNREDDVLNGLPGAYQSFVTPVVLGTCW